VNMGRNKGGGGGCLIWGIVIVGNLLLFSGLLFGDLVDNSIAWILAIIAVVIDVVFIGSQISSASKRREQGANEQEANTRSVPTPPIRRTVEQVAHIERSDNSKLGLLKAKYSVPSVPIIPSTVDPLQKDMESYQSLEIIQTVNRVVNLRSDLIKELAAKRQELDAILSCPGCSTDRERIKYLNTNEAELNQKKKEYLDIIDLINSKKVVLLSKENQVYSGMRVLFSEIAKSQKIVGDAGIAYKDFVKMNATLPGDFFETRQAPIELNFGAYRFFMLPDVVLAYNRSGEFVTAFEPMAMIIRVEERQKNVYSSNMGGRGWTYSDNVIASDSTLISQGYARSGWLHEKKSGGPDLRYSFANNPRYESRTDTYAFTEINIQIGHYKAVYSASKGALAVTAKQTIRKYCSISHKLNVMPSLLRLLESTAKKKDEAKDLCNEYIKVCNDIICKEA
jgi:hypothetical protein